MWESARLAIAEETRCAVQADVRTGNQASDTFFRQRVLRQAAVGRPAVSRPDTFAEAVAFGAAGDGVTDDTAALQRALNEAHKVWLSPGRTYRITRRLDL